VPTNLEYRVAFKAIHDVLLNEWDPIGVNDAPEARDEYDNYIPVIPTPFRGRERPGNSRPPFQDCIGLDGTQASTAPQSQDCGTTSRSRGVVENLVIGGDSFI
jgi:hypothetical protein